MSQTKLSVNRMVDGGYLSWAYGAIGSKAWQPMRREYSRRSGSLLCLDSQRSFRKEFYPDYKSHRKAKREKRSQIHEKVVNFQAYLREDSSLMTWGVDGLEADDLIAVTSLSKGLPALAQDKDLLQIPDLVMTRLDGSRVTIEHFASRQAKKVEPLVRTPEQILLTLTLLGDKSDDIPRLVPPKGLQLFELILTSENPWKRAEQMFKTEDLYRNLALAILPSPWCFKKVPLPDKLYAQVSSGEFWSRRDWSNEILEFLELLEVQESCDNW